MSSWSSFAAILVRELCTVDMQGNFVACDEMPCLCLSRRPQEYTATTAKIQRSLLFDHRLQVAYTATLIQGNISM